MVTDFLNWMLARKIRNKGTFFKNRKCQFRYVFALVLRWPFPISAPELLQNYVRLKSLKGKLETNAKSFSFYKTETNNHEISKKDK